MATYRTEYAAVFPLVWGWFWSAFFAGRPLAEATARTNVALGAVLISLILLAFANRGHNNYTDGCIDSLVFWSG